MKKKHAQLCLMIRKDGVDAYLNREGKIKHGKMPALLLKTDAVKAGKELAEQLRKVSLWSAKAVLLLPSNWFQRHIVNLEKIPEDQVDSYLELQCEKFFGERSYSKIMKQADLAIIYGLTAELRDELHSTMKGAGITAVSIAPLAIYPEAPLANAVTLQKCGNVIELALYNDGLPVAFRTFADSISMDNLLCELRLTCGESGIGMPALFYDEDMCDGEGFNGYEHHPYKNYSEKQIAEYVFEQIQAKAELKYCVTPPKQESHLAFFKKLQKKQKTSVIAAVVVLLLVLFPLMRMYKLHSLENRMAVLKPRLDKVEKIRGNVTQYSTWTRRRPEMLQLLAGITNAFPQEGKVWLTRLEIKQDDKIFLTGSANSESDWLDTQEEMQKNPALKNLRTVQTRAGNKNNLVQFTAVITLKKGTGK